MPELVIGGRRAPQQRGWRALFFALALVVVAFVVGWFIYRRSVSYDQPGGDLAEGAVMIEQASPAAPPRLSFGKSTLEWQGGLAVLRARGDDQALGAAHGRLLGIDVQRSLAAMAPTLAHAVTGGFLGSWGHDVKLAWRYRFVDDRISSADRRVIAGMVRGGVHSGASLDYELAIRAHVALDVGVPARWTAEAETRQLSRALTMVVPQDGPIQGRRWVARSFALPGLGDGGEGETPLVSFLHPEGRLAWASVGWPGMVGAVTGINAEGLTVMVHPGRARDVRATRAAIPTVLLARTILENARTLDAAIALLKDTPTMGAASFVLVEGKTGDWAVVVRTPRKVSVSRSPDPPVVGDVMVGEAVADDPDNDRAKRVLVANDRVARAAQLVRTPVSEVAAIAAMLRDDRAADGGSLPLGHRGAIADPAAAHVVILDPGAMVMWVADRDAGAGYVAFDLRYELRGEGGRASPPAALAAAADRPASAVAQLWRARSDLREARRAVADRAWHRASEWIERALARTPSLPEALELAGEVARARGDTSAARRFWQRWLDGRADNPGAEEEVRAVLGGT